MSRLKRIFDFYINSSIHVALAVYAMSWLTLLQFDLVYDKHVLYFVFFATITGYNFVKYFGLAKLYHRSLARWLKVIQVFSMLCFAALCFYAYKLNLQTLISVGIFGLATFLYAVPVLPKKIFLDKQHNLRSISGLKIYIIALVWTGVTVFLPLINANYAISDDVILTALQRFLFVIVLMFPFEIRDLNYDSLKLATVPQQIGMKRTKLIGVVLLLFYFLLEFLKDDINNSRIIILGVVTLITMLFLAFSNTKRPMFYSSFFVEAIPIVWLLLSLIF